MNTKYTPAQQLDMFAPVQLGLGIDPAQPRHLTEAEAEALAEVIHRKLLADYPGYTLLDASLQCDKYNLDNDSKYRTLLESARLLDILD